MTDTSNRKMPTDDTADLNEKTAVSKTKNALIHGVYASDNVLPWESEEDFESVHAELRAEWSPDGRTEEETVLSLARLHWLKHRLMRSTQMAFRRDPFVAELEKAGVNSWAGVQTFLKSNADERTSLMKAVRETLEALTTATKKASDMMTADDRDTHKIYDGFEMVHMLFEKHNQVVYQKAFDLVHGQTSNNQTSNNINTAPKATMVEQAYHPDYLEKIVRLEASIDTRIDKTLSRLVNVKEYKRVAKATAPKKIISESIAPA